MEKYKFTILYPFSDEIKTITYFFKTKNNFARFRKNQENARERIRKKFGDGFGLHFSENYFIDIIYYADIVKSDFEIVIDGEKITDAKGLKFKLIRSNGNEDFKEGQGICSKNCSKL